MNSNHLNPLDAVWLMMESADTPMHIGVLAIFRKPRNAAGTWLSSLAAGMRESRKPVAPWNYRLAERSGSR